MATVDAITVGGGRAVHEHVAAVRVHARVVHDDRALAGRQYVELVFQFPLEYRSHPNINAKRATTAATAVAGAGGIVFILALDEILAIPCDGVPEAFTVGAAVLALVEVAHWIALGRAHVHARSDS